MDDIDDDHLFKPISSPIDVDGSVMGDDVFEFLFDKHPIDKKKEFAIVVNITP